MNFANLIESAGRETLRQTNELRPKASMNIRDPACQATYENGTGVPDPLGDVVDFMARGMGPPTTRYRCPRDAFSKRWFLAFGRLQHDAVVAQESRGLLGRHDGQPAPRNVRDQPPSTLAAGLRRQPSDGLAVRRDVSHLDG